MDADSNSFQSYLFLTSSKRDFKLGWTQFLYIALPLEWGILATLFTFNFMGLVPTVDYYWSILLHIFHLFSWASVYACLSKCFSLPFYRTTIVTYGFSFFLDLAASLWRIITTSICSSVECVDYRLYGVIGYCLSIVLLIWDVIVFITLLFVIRTIVTQLVQHSARIKRNEAADATSANTSENPDTDGVIQREYSKLIESPLPNSLFSRRFVLVVGAILEPLFFFGILIIAMLGLVISPMFLWTVFLGSLHSFTFVFVSACVNDNYSKSWHTGTLALYVTNLLLDIGAFSWRTVLLIQCDPSTNVDCIFRSFPGWIPIQLLTGFLIVNDLVAIFSLAELYRWLYVNAWIRVDRIEKRIDRETRRIGLVKRPKNVELEEEENAKQEEEEEEQNEKDQRNQKAENDQQPLMSSTRYRYRSTSDQWLRHRNQKEPDQKVAGKTVHFL